MEAIVALVVFAVAGGIILAAVAFVAVVAKLTLQLVLLPIKLLLLPIFLVLLVVKMAVVFAFLAAIAAVIIPIVVIIGLFAAPFLLVAALA